MVAKVGAKLRKTKRFATMTTEMTSQQILEQEFLLNEFGDEYALYCESVPPLLPLGLKQRPVESIRTGSFNLSTALTFERMTLVWQVLIWAVLLWKAS